MPLMMPKTIPPAEMGRKAAAGSPRLPPPLAGQRHPAAVAPTGRAPACPLVRFRSALAHLAISFALWLCLPAAVSALAAESAYPVAYEGRDRETADVAEPTSSVPVIGGIIIRNENIFDLDDPEENNWLFRLANNLHIRTRPSVVADQLLFRTGDRYDRQLLEESARILRSNRYLYDAWVQPVANRDGQVDIEVRTRDVWTLRPGISFERKGGRNTTSFSIEEVNLLGRGSEIRIARTSTPDRDENLLEYTDPHLFRTWTRANVLLADASDGRRLHFLLERPFYALQTPWATGVLAADEKRIDSLYQGGDIVSQFRTRAKLLRLYGGRSGGLRDRWVRRWTFGATWDESRFSALNGEPVPAPIPGDRVLAYPWVGIEIIEDDFEEARNRNQIERTEDFFLGTRFGATLGYANPAFGADRHAIPFSSLLENGFSLGKEWILTLVTTADGRIENGKTQDTILSAIVRQYVRQSEKWLFYTSLSGSRAFRPDNDRQILLGGDTGLRGYPMRYQAGDRRFLLTLEQRYFTDWYPFRLFRIGAAAFFDMGRAWGESPAEPPAPGFLKDVGLGLRIGMARSGLGNVIHVDVAFPLDGDPSIAGVQVLVVTKTSF
jgi:hypothetical protein